MSTEVDERPRQEIQAGPAPTRRLSWIKLLLPAQLSGVLLSLAHFPFAWGFLGWVALVPLLYLVRAPASRWRLFLAAWLAGLTFFVTAIAWMRVAHITMAAAWILLSLYCSFYVPVAIGLTRYLDRRTSLPLVVSVPVVWTALEYLRAHFLSGFAWYFLGHTQHDVLPVIQIADLTGAYGVTFVVAAVNALLFELLWRASRRNPDVSTSAEVSPSPRALIFSGVAVFLLLAATLGYGFWQLGRDDFGVGPRVALVQSSLDQRFRNDKASETSAETMIRHNIELTDWAARQKPDLMVWPETSWPEDWVEVSPDVGLVPPDWLDRAKRSQLLATRAASRWQAPLLMGLNSQYLDANGQGRRHNSAVLIQTDAGVGGQYHKMHRVPFGEFVPFRDTLPWLSILSPYDYDYSITPGETFTRFPLAGYHFGVIICYEDSDPLLARQYVADEPVDFLVNISNDGWFDGTSEHDEHLAICRFRAVECRRAVLRAVNMGISAIIDGNGRIREPDQYWLGEEVQQGQGDVPVSRWHEFKQRAGVLIAAVPLDGRPSLYAQWGDWLPIGCWMLLGVALITARGRKV